MTELWGRFKDNLTASTVLNTGATGDIFTTYKALQLFCYF